MNRSKREGTTCLTVWGRPFKQLTPDERKLFTRYSRKASYYMNHELNKERQRLAKQRVKSDLLKELGWEPKCSQCGYDKCIAALDFHHKDPNQKEYLVLSKSFTIQERVVEAQKCNLLCSNCHREQHFNVGQSTSGRKPQNDPLFQKFLASYMEQRSRDATN